jgi:hypothetical protein
MEMSMAYTLSVRDRFHYFPHNAAPTSNVRANRPGLLSRIFHALFESRQRQADREIARFVAQSGGRLTDDMERQMTQRLLTGNWWGGGG